MEAKPEYIQTEAGQRALRAEAYLQDTYDPQIVGKNQWNGSVTFLDTLGINMQDMKTGDHTLTQFVKDVIKSINDNNYASLLYRL